MGRLPVTVFNIGRMPYLKAINIQAMAFRKHMNNQSTGENANCILIVEHDHVYTVGVRNKTYTPEVEKRLRNLGADFCVTDRGGLITYHGPGQLVAYPVINLKDFRLRIKDYISAVEATIVNTCHCFGIRAVSTKDVGVWVEDRKIAAIGVHASRFVTTHGLAINCDTDLTWFKHIVPCGLVDKDVTSFSVELGKRVTGNQVLHVFLKCFSDVFNCDVILDNLNSSAFCGTS